MLVHWLTQQCHGDEVTLPSLGLQESNMHHTSLLVPHSPSTVPSWRGVARPGIERREKALVIRGLGLTRHLGPAQEIRSIPSDHLASGTTSIPMVTCGTYLYSPSLLPLGPRDQAWLSQMTYVASTIGARAPPSCLLPASLLCEPSALAVPRALGDPY